MTDSTARTGIDASDRETMLLLSDFDADAEHGTDWSRLNLDATELAATVLVPRGMIRDAAVVGDAMGRALGQWAAGQERRGRWAELRAKHQRR